MKIQYLAVIFIIIMLPIILVVSTYMQFQVDNLSKDIQYDAKLFQATIDGMQAFELNTVNNRFSQVADSLKRDVEAGINTFISSLSSSVGYSGINNQFLLPYLPAVLFTLYDGYYIYAPTYAEELSEIKVTEKDIDRYDIEVSKEANTGTTDHEHMLKPYIYYTTRYQSGNSDTKSSYYDFVVNYTLDNYMTVYGTVGGEYVTRSGFLSNPNKILITIDTDRLTAILARKIMEYIETPRALDNWTEEQILAKYASYSVDDLNRVMKDSSVVAAGQKSTIVEVALKNEIGEYLYNIMTNNPANARTEMRNRSISYKNDLIEAIFDSLIDEKFSIDRNVVEEIVAREVLEAGGYIAWDKLSGLSQNDVLSTFIGTYSGNDTELTNISTTFKNNIQNFDDLLSDITKNVEERDKETRITEFKNYIANSIGIPLLQEILKNDKKSLSDIDDDYLFSLISGRTIFHQESKYGREVMVDMIRHGNNYIDEIIDAFTVTYDKQNITESDAKRYYVKSFRFTNWVNKNLGKITEGDAVQERLEKNDDNTPGSSSTKTVKLFPEAATGQNGKKVFSISNSNDPDLEVSDFAQHRMKCIQASIQTNLNMAISQYNQDFFQRTQYSLTMPVMSSSEWYKITNNISMVSFFQGMRVGNKIYNDYAVVTSNKNKETINTDHIYYIDTNAQGPVAYYHRADCSLLTNGNIVGLKNIDYDVYKDEGKNSNIDYTFGEKLNERIANTNISEVYACYHCIVQRDYTSTDMNDARKNAQYTAIAREKNNLYKVNGYYNDDILTEFVAPPSSVLGTLYEKATTGDYVIYNNQSNWKVTAKNENSKSIVITRENSSEAPVTLENYLVVGGDGSYNNPWKLATS